MSVVDPGLPDLHERDPRLCPGRDDYAETIEHFDGVVPDWLGPEPFTGPHTWPEYSTRDGAYCRVCQVSREAVRERFSDWRYEQLVEGLTKAVKQLAGAIERKNW